MPGPNPNSKLSHELIPDELWSRVCTSLDHRALRSLCRSSTRMLRIARPVLYEDVILRVEWNEKNKRPNSVETINLLKADERLAQYVSSLAVSFSTAPFSGVDLPTALDPLLIENLTRLKAVTFMGSVFGSLDAATIDRMVTSLEGCSLKHLKLHIEKDGYQLSPSQMARIGSKLESLDIVDDTEITPLEPPLLMVKSSQCSLTVISFIFDLSNEDSMRQFFTMKFPHLQSLTLGVWYPTPKEFAGFIAKNSAKLETLCLGYSHSGEGATAFPLSGQDLREALSKFTPHMLPKLQTFKGHTSCLQFMAYAQLDCLSSITKLSIGSAFPCYGSVPQRWEKMFAAFRDSPAPCLAGVKELFLDATDWVEERQVVELLVHGMAEFCGQSLEVWNGGLPARQDILGWTGWSTRHLKMMFGEFPKLRVLYLRELPSEMNEEEDEEYGYETEEELEEDSDEDEESGGRKKSWADSTYDCEDRTVYELAKSCPLLERVYQYNEELSTDFGWAIERVGTTTGSTDSDTFSESSIKVHNMQSDFPTTLENTPVGMKEVM